MINLILSPPEYSVLMALLEDGIETNQSHALLQVFAELREKIVLQACRRSSA